MSVRSKVLPAWVHRKMTALKAGIVQNGSLTGSHETDGYSLTAGRRSCKNGASGWSYWISRDGAVIYSGINLDAFSTRCAEILNNREDIAA